MVLNSAVAYRFSVQQAGIAKSLDVGLEGYLFNGFSVGCNVADSVFNVFFLFEIERGVCKAIN
jgi:hypothetical protein